MRTRPLLPVLIAGQLALLCLLPLRNAAGCSISGPSEGAPPTATLHAYVGTSQTPTVIVPVNTNITLRAEDAVDWDLDGPVPVLDQPYGDFKFRYAWSFDGGQLGEFSDSNSTIHQWTTTGTHYITLQVSDPGDFFDDPENGYVPLWIWVVSPGSGTSAGNFDAAPGDCRSTLTWTKPSDVDGVLVCYRTDHYPANPWDGTYAADTTGTTASSYSRTVTGLINGQDYYFTAFAHDAQYNCYAGVNAPLHHTFYVNKNAQVTPPAQRDGKSWATAFATVGDGIALTSSHDVLVAGSTGSGASYAGDLFVPEGVSLYGGYSGQGTERNSEIYKTVLDGQAGSDSVVCFADGVNSTSVVDGFTITGGGGHGTYHYGGGMYCPSGTSPVISNNAITNNYATMGAGIYCLDAAPRIINNTITGNTAVSYGGGVYLSGPSTADVINNTIVYNKTTGTSPHGAGIYCNCPISTCKIYNNIVAWNSLEGVYKNGPTLRKYNYSYDNTGGNFVPALSNSETGNVDSNAQQADPLFIDDGGWNSGGEWLEGSYTLSASPNLSPCIDAGLNDAGIPTTDKAGNARSIDGNNDGQAIPDIGAYEFVPPPPGAPVVTSPTTGSTVMTSSPVIQWTSDVHDKYQLQLTAQGNSSDFWDSGQIDGQGQSCQVGRQLLSGVSYSVIVRIHNGGGWGAWSAAGHTFAVDGSAGELDFYSSLVRYCND